MAPIQANLHRSQFSSPPLFLGCDGRHHIIHNHMTYHTPWLHPTSEKYMLCAVLCPEAFKIGLNLIFLLLYCSLKFFPSWPHPLSSANSSPNFPWSRNWLEHFCLPPIIPHSHCTITSMGMSPVVRATKRSTKVQPQLEPLFYNWSNSDCILDSFQFDRNKKVKHFIIPSIYHTYFFHIFIGSH